MSRRLVKHIVKHIAKHRKHGDFTKNKWYELAIDATPDTSEHVLLVAIWSFSTLVAASDVE
jgi:hypothetical protein